MDEQSAIVGWVALGISVFGSIIGVINHRKIRSQCCGRTGEIALDITDTTDSHIQVKPEEPKAPSRSATPPPIEKSKDIEAAK